MLSLAVLVLLPAMALPSTWRGETQIIPTDNPIIEKSTPANKRTQPIDGGRWEDLSAYAWHAWFGGHLREGHWAWWNPNQMLGMPTLASDHIAPYFPTTQLLRWMDVDSALLLAAWMKLLVGGLGMWILARQQNLGPPARLLCGATWMLGGLLPMGLLDNTGNVLCILPWCVMLALSLAQRQRFWKLWALALVLALQFLGGHIGGSVAVLLSILLGLLLRVDWGQLVLAVPALLLALAIGMAGGAIQLWPKLHHILRSTSVFEGAEPTAWPWPLSMFANTSAYLPAVATSVGVVLAVVALYRFRPLFAALGWLGVLLLSAALGIIVYVAPQLDGSFAFLENADLRMLLVPGAVGLTLLSGMGLQTLETRRNITATALLTLMMIVSFMIAAFAAIVFLGYDRSQHFANLARVAAPLIGVTLLAVGLRWSWVAALIAIAELLPFTMHHWRGPSDPPASYVVAADKPGEFQPPSMVARALEVMDGDVVMAASPGVWHVDAAANVGVTDLRSSVAVPHRLAVLLAGEGWRPKIVTPEPGAPAALLLSVNAAFITHDDIYEPRYEGWRVIRSSSEGVSLLMRDAKPKRAWLCEEAELLEHYVEAPVRLAAEGFDPAKTVLLDKQLPHYARESLGWANELDKYYKWRGRSRNAKAPTQGDSPNEWKVNGVDRGWYVWLQSFDPGWRCEVRYSDRNGDRRMREMEVLPAYAGLQTVFVPTTRSRLTLRYEPPALREGLLISTAAGCLIILLMGISCLTPSGERPREDADSWQRAESD